MALSRLRSATGFFSLRFSSSSCRMCFSSDGEITPYFLRHASNVASEIPSLRQTSGTLMYPVQPASGQICSSVNCDFFIGSTSARGSINHAGILFLNGAGFWVRISGWRNIWIRRCLGNLQDVKNDFCIYYLGQSVCCTGCS